MQESLEIEAGQLYEAQSNKGLVLVQAQSPLVTVGGIWFCLEVHTGLQVIIPASQFQRRVTTEPAEASG